MKEPPMRRRGRGAEGAGRRGKDCSNGNGDSRSATVSATLGGNRHSQPPIEPCSFRPVFFGAFGGRDAGCREILLLWRKNNAEAEFGFRNRPFARGTGC